MKRSARTALLAAVGALAAVACSERPDERAGPPAGSTPQSAAQSRLVPGMGAPPAKGRPNPYSGDAAAIAEGKRLYNWFNCSGCHSQGGGGMGPPLMDDKWIYGNAPANLFQVIVEGRSGGMPAFGGHIPEQQIWQIIAFIETMGGMRSGDDAQTGGEGGLDAAPRGPGVKAREGDTRASEEPKKVEGDPEKSAERDPSTVGKGSGPAK